MSKDSMQVRLALEEDYAEIVVDERVFRGKLSTSAVNQLTRRLMKKQFTVSKYSEDSTELVLHFKTGVGVDSYLSKFRSTFTLKEVVEIPAETPESINNYIKRMERMIEDLQEIVQEMNAEKQI